MRVPAAAFVIALSLAGCGGSEPPAKHRIDWSLAVREAEGSEFVRLEYEAHPADQETRGSRNSADPERATVRISGDGAVIGLWSSRRPIESGTLGIITSCVRVPLPASVDVVDLRDEAGGGDGRAATPDQEREIREMNCFDVEVDRE